MAMLSTSSPVFREHLPAQQSSTEYMHGSIWHGAALHMQRMLQQSTAWATGHEHAHSSSVRGALGMQQGHASRQVPEGSSSPVLAQAWAQHHLVQRRGQAPVALDAADVRQVLVARHQRVIVGLPV